MKILIAYATKTGTTKKCADMLIRRLSSLGEITSVNLCSEKCDAAEFDLVIMGGSVRIGQVHKALKKFIEVNQNSLREKKTALYICSGFVDRAEEVFEQNFSEKLLKSLITSECFGGELDLSVQKGIDKLMVKAITKGEDFVPPQILTERIDFFAEKIKNSLS